MLKTLAPNPLSRYQAAVTLAGELRAIAALLDQRELAEDEQAPEPSSRAAPIVAALLLLALAGAVVFWYLSRG